MSSKREAQFERYKTILTHYKNRAFNRDDLVADFGMDRSPASNVITAMKKRGLIHVVNAETKSHKAVSGALVALSKILEKEQQAFYLRCRELKASKKNPSNEEQKEEVSLPYPPKLPIMQMFDDLLAGVRS